MSAVPRLREYRGPALFSYGFRPFFLLGAIHAAIAIPLWLLAFYGVIPMTTAFAPRDWHVHDPTSAVWRLPRREIRGFAGVSLGAAGLWC